jgi:hypothetical protein
MQGRTSNHTDKWSLRMCLSCGCTEGPQQAERDELEDPFDFNEDTFSVGTPSCPECGCDLAERPPMSYAEMEGLPDAPPRASRADAWAEALESRSIERWMGTSFILLVGAVLLFGLITN